MKNFAVFYNNKFKILGNPELNKQFEELHFVFLNNFGGLSCSNIYYKPTKDNSLNMHPLKSMLFFLVVPQTILGTDSL